MALRDDQPTPGDHDEDEDHHDEDEDHHREEQDDHTTMALRDDQEDEDHHDEDEDHHDEDEDHDHDHDEGEPHPEDSPHWIIEHFDENLDGVIDRVEFEELYDTMFGVHDHDDHDDHDHEEDDHDHEEEGDHDHEEEDDHDHEEEGDHDHEEGKRHTINTREFVDICPEPTTLFDERDLDASDTLDESELVIISSDFTVMMLQGCGDEEIAEEEDDDCEEPSSAEKWGFGFLAVIIVSLISLAGIVILPVKDAHLRGHIIYALIAFAVGSLFGDTVLHLLPFVWGIHAHGASEEEEEDERDFLYKGIVIFAGLLIFLLMETAIHHITHKVAKDIEMRSPASDDQKLTDSQEHDEFYSNFVVPDQPADKWSDIKAVGWLNLVSDAAHNLTDGLAMGAAFSVSLSTGLATTIAICMHEVPQELADFGILLHAGFSKTWAILFNLLSALWAMLGLVIGLAIGESVEDAEKWILAITAGGFLYIALADMLPILLKRPRLRRLIAAAVFINLGFWIMFVISWFEDDLGGCGHSHDHDHDH
eukprot:CAMPEP_0201560242 /NCGR_PEP_ID=MMETSP0173_2-20130828/78168_1 /ASSEMBLY_ACC=CAM_ASM_000268 /TAXON_ID=218659 /ORGANISM="Vexillifera sp., Strain DIVA3 564/2" /LENGTH=534 /DNA_ID=CAMNT_0047974685 /DNA_START=232 /DNA_END=1836 /DNA_ORIENTATION=-